MSESEIEEVLKSIKTKGVVGFVVMKNAYTKDDIDYEGIAIRTSLKEEKSKEMVSLVQGLIRSAKISLKTLNGLGQSKDDELSYGDSDDSDDEAEEDNLVNLRLRTKNNEEIIVIPSSNYTLIVIQKVG